MRGAGGSSPCRGLGQSPKALCRSIFRERCERPKARREACALWALATEGGKATRSAPEGSVSPVGCCAQRKATRRCEQIQGLRAASAQNADICEGSETMSAPEGSVSPVGCCAQRKATRRREQIQGLCAAAHRTPIFAKGREARMIEQPGRKKRGSSQNQGFFNDLSAALPQWKGGALRQALANLPRTLSICCCWACSLGYQPWAAIFW